MTKEEEGAVGTPPGGEADDRPEGEVAGAVPEGELSHQELLLTLQDARERADTHWNELLRARAELVNLQRRAERDVESAHKYALEKFVNELLPVIDSLELGIDAAVQSGGEGAERLREGMELTLKMCLTAVGKFGVQQISPLGERFDPALHQAMTVQPATPGTPPNHVTAVYQKGYMLNERLVRPAMVVVSAPESGGQGSTPRIDEMA